MNLPRSLSLGVLLVLVAACTWWALTPSDTFKIPGNDAKQADVVPPQPAGVQSMPSGIEQQASPSDEGPLQPGGTQRVEVEISESIEVAAGELGFYGTVVSPEVPLDQLWVRLNILSVSPEIEQTFDTEDYLTWVHSPSILRSRAKRLDENGTFRLLGRAPGLLPGNVRRYAIEIGIDPPGDGFPMFGKKELLPVAIHWIGDAETESMHGPFSIQAQAPYHVSTHIHVPKQLQWAKERIQLVSKLSRLSDAPEDHDRFEAIPRRDPVDFFQSPLASFNRDLYLSSLSPRWNLEQSLALSTHRGDVRVSETIATTLVEGDVKVELNFAEFSYLLARIDGPIPEEADLSVKYLQNGVLLTEANGLRVDRLTERREQDSSPGDRSPATNESTLPAISGLQLRMDPGELLRDEWGAWCALGWLPNGRYSIEISTLDDEQKWTAMNVQLSVAGTKRVQLEAQVNPRITRVIFPPGFLGHEYFALRVFDANGKGLSKSNEFNNRLEAANAGDVQVDLPLPFGTRYLSAVDWTPDGEFETCSAVLPFSTEPPEQISMRAHPTRIQLDAGSEVVGTAPYAVRSLESTSHTAGSARVDVLLPFVPRHFSLLGLPPGDYFLKHLAANSRTELDPFSDEHEPVQASPPRPVRKNLEFRVK